MSASLKPTLLLLLVSPTFAFPFVDAIAPPPAADEAAGAGALAEWPGTAFSVCTSRDLVNEGGLIDETLKLNGLASLLLACCCCCDCSSTFAGFVAPAPPTPVDVWK